MKLDGVMSYVVSQRTKEIGIRVALGAGQSEIVRMILWQSACLAGYGAAGGVAVALALTAAGRESARSNPAVRVAAVCGRSGRGVGSGAGRVTCAFAKSGQN